MEHVDPIRLAAFRTIREMIAFKPHVTAQDLSAGFYFEGRRHAFLNQQQGIFKPAAMSHLLSIRTVYPRQGGRIWYDDQRTVHEQIYKGIDVVRYSFMRENPNSAQNQWLRQAMLEGVPIIYFLGVAPGTYLPILPTYIVDWDAASLSAGVAFGVDAASAQPSSPFEAMAPALERQYALREVKQRLHQSTFREAVLQAYDGRCALSGLPESLLIDAAHIISDKDERLGQPVVPNGLPLSKIHHAAFDSHLIGIDPDYSVHVSERLLAQKDGPMLEAIKQLNGRSILLPSRMRDRPDRDRLAQRFEAFKEAA